MTDGVEIEDAEMKERTSSLGVETVRTSAQKDGADGCS